MLIYDNLDDFGVNIRTLSTMSCQTIWYPELSSLWPVFPLTYFVGHVLAYLGTVDCARSDVKFEESSEGEYADDELDDDAPRQPFMASSLPRSCFSMSPSFTTSLGSGSMKPPGNFAPQIISPMGAILHKRNDSGFFDTSVNKSERNKQGNNDKASRQRDAFVKCEDYLRNELSTSSEETNISEDVSECSSSSIKARKANEIHLSSVVASYAQLKTFKVCYYFQIVFY